MQHTILRHFLFSIAAAIFLGLFSVGCSYTLGDKDGASPPGPEPPNPGLPAPGDGSGNGNGGNGNGGNGNGGSGVSPLPNPDPTLNSALGTPVLETPMRRSDADSSYSARWTQVPGASYYHIQESCSDSENDGINWNPSAPSPLLQYSNEYNLGIRSHTFCYFRMRASAWNDVHSRWSNIVTLNNLFFIEESPRSNVSDSYDGSYTIHWNNLPNAYYYDLEESTDGGTTWVRILLSDRQKSMQSFSSKETGNTYRYKVRACGIDDKCGPWNRQSSDSDLVKTKIPKTVLNINGSSGSYTVFETNGGFRSAGMRPTELIGTSCRKVKAGEPLQI